MDSFGTAGHLDAEGCVLPSPSGVVHVALARPEPELSGLPAWSAAVPGTSIQATSAPRIAAGSGPSSGTAVSASGWGVFSLLPERSYLLDLYNFTTLGSMPYPDRSGI